MTKVRRVRRAFAAAAPGEAAPATLGLFEYLLPPADWARLPAPVRRRFSRHVDGTHTAVYAGEVVSTELTPAGRVLGQLARLVGAPLPLSAGRRVAACVVVSGDSARRQRWTRIYCRPGRTPQVIHSTKCFSGPTGLEECVGGGIGMRLRLSVERRALVFRSAGFFLRLGRLSIPLPSWLTPGAIEVEHREERGGRFSFSLRVIHPWFGVVVRQTAFFEERLAPAAPAVTEA